MQTIHVNINRNVDDPETNAQWIKEILADHAGITTAKVTAVAVPGNDNVWEAIVKIENEECEALMTYLIEEGCPADAIRVEG